MLNHVVLPLPSGARLVGDYHPSSSPFAVVWVHGFGSHRGGEKASAVREACAAFDFRGHGDTSGPMHELRASRQVDDLAAVRGFLADRGHTRLGLVGSSMGGFAAAWFAVRNPGDVVGCVLLAPAFRFLHRRWDNLTPEQREDWRQTDRLRVTNEWVNVDVGYGLVEERDQFRPDDLAAAWAAPALIFHGWADDVVPAADSLAFLGEARYPEVELRLLKAGDHRLTAHKDEIAAEVVRFFDRLSRAETPVADHR